jgi:hypothetical protein
MGTRVDESLRALLEGDLEQYPAHTAQLDERGWNAFGELVGSAFHRAVGHRFLPGQDAAEITRFVETANQPYAGTPLAIDVAAGAALVRSVLGDSSDVGEVLERFDEPDLARIELVLLRRLIADAGLTGAAFDQFLEDSGTEARPFAGEDTAASA